MIDNLDKSFLRLKTSFAEAKFELLQDSEFVYKENIVLNPTKIYTQISNSASNIAFDDSYICELVDCSDNVVLDITDKVYINEFQSHEGVYQIAFEIAPIGEDFYFERLFLKFTHLDSELKLWSNPVLVTEQCKTFRLEYKNYNYYQGTSYEIANIYQSIDLVGYIDLPNTKETTKIYTQLNGDIRQSRPIQAIEYLFNIDFIDSFTFTRLSTALNSELIYINGVRFIKSENVQSDAREGKANFFPTSFKGQFIETDTLDLGFQIAPQFDVIDYYPKGLYTLSIVDNEINLTFNYDAIDTDNVNLRILLYKDDSFIDYLDLVQDTNPLIWKQTYTFIYNGEYEIRVPANKYKSIYGQFLEYMVFPFSIQDGEFDVTEFDSTEFFTN